MTTASSYSSLVQELYVAYFGRPADYFGLQNFEAALAAANAPTTIAGLEAAYSTNTAVKTLVDSFGTSAESTALYGSGSTESFVTAIFENLLNRAPAVAGLSFWVNAVNSGTVTKGDAALAIAAGAAANATPLGLTDAQTIANKLTVAANFTTNLGASSLDITAYSGSAAATAARGLIAGVGSVTDTTAYQSTVQSTITAIVGDHFNNTYNLTTGVDTIVGGPGNNAYNAVLDNAAGISAGAQAATLNSFDTITGGTLKNTLSINDFGIGGQMALPAATITGMTTLNINSLEGMGAGPGSLALDFTTIGNLANVTINASNGADFVKVGANTALVVNDTGHAAVFTYGGSTVTVNNNPAALSHGNYVQVIGGSATTAVTINGGLGVATSVADANQGSGKANTIATVTANGQTSWSTNIFSDALTALNISASSESFTTVHAMAGTRTLTLTLDGDGVTSGYATQPVQVIDDAATAIVVDAVTAASKNFWLQATSAAALTFNDAVDLSFFENTIAGSGATLLNATAAKAVTITGAGAFSADLGGLNVAAVINASGSSGIDTLTMGSAVNSALAAQSFAGGSGQDIITVGASQTGTIAGGSAGNNEIVLDNIAGASTSALTPYSHFSVLGVAGSTDGVFDMSKVAGYNAFDVQASGGDVTFTNVANNAVLSVDGANSHIITLQTADTTGASDSVTVNLGTAAGTLGFTVNQITLEDGQFDGIGTVNLVSNSGNHPTNNTITTLADNNLVTLNVTGSSGLEIDNLTDNSTTLTLNLSNGIAAGQSDSGMYLGNLTDNYLTTLTLNGPATPDIGSVIDSATTLTINYNETFLSIPGNIDTLTDASLTALTISNSQSSAANIFSINNAVSAPALASLSLIGNVTINIAGDAVTGGVTIAGATDNATVDFNVSATVANPGTGTLSGKTDSIALGNGDGDSVILSNGVAGSTQTVVFGTGANDNFSSGSAGTVNVTMGSAASGTDNISVDSASVVHITVGNGTNTIDSVAGFATVTVAAGTGSNTVNAGGDAIGTISFGAHATGTDAVGLHPSDTSLTAIFKISGLNDSASSTDSIIFYGDLNTLTGFTQVTAGSVVASGGNTTLLDSWVAAADGATGSNVATAGAAPGAAHGVTWFQFGGNTYILESVAGAAADHGTMVAGNTLVELVGTGYTFTHATGTGGTLFLLG